MRIYKIVIDTNVFISALRSKQGASYKLVSNIDSDKFIANISVPLVIEYESVAKREELEVTNQAIDDILDFICAHSMERKIHFLWRPFLKDVKDDMVLELAVGSGSDYIITYNKKDFKGIDTFNIEVLTAKEFLDIIGL